MLRGRLPGRGRSALLRPAAPTRCYEGVTLLDELQDDAHDIVDVLRGAETEKIIASGHHRLHAFGSGAARKKEEWRSLIRQLAANGFLNHDVAGFGGLSLTEDGRAVLRGEKPFQCRKDAVRGETRKERAAQTVSALNDDQAALLAVLKKLRLTLAARRNLPAYLIFSDKTLIEMARTTPRNLHEFAMVNGVGTSKLRDFGQAFLDAIAAYRRSAA